MSLRRAGAIALALLGFATPARSDPPRRTVPRTPWTTVDPFPLGGAGVTPPLPLPDGRVAVFTRAPSTLTLVDSARGTVRSSPLEEPPSDRIAPRCDALGRLVILGGGGTLFRLGYDGRVRGAAQLVGELLGVVERADGTEVAVVANRQHVDFVSLRTDGTIAAARTFAASPTTAPAALRDGRIAVGVPRGLAVFDPAGTIRLLPGVDGLQHLVSIDDAVFAVTEDAIFPLDASGVAAPPWPLPARTRWWSSSTDGTALAWMDGPPSAMLRVDLRGVLQRIVAPPFTEYALRDSSGAFLLASRLGRLVALDPDGSERWVIDLRRAIVPRIVLGADGDAWVTAVDGNLLRLSSPPPVAQEAPRANR